MAPKPRSFYEGEKRERKSYKEAEFTNQIMHSSLVVEVKIHFVPVHDKIITKSVHKVNKVGCRSYLRLMIEFCYNYEQL